MDLQKIIIILFWVLFTAVTLYVLYTFGMNKERQNKAKYEIEIKENKRKMDSIQLSNSKIKEKLDSLNTKKINLETGEKIIIQKIFTQNEKIDKIKSLPNILPDSSNYRFFAEFEADTTSKR